MPYRNDMTVQLVKASASDLDVVRAARVSTGNDSEDLNLIGYLMKNRHGSPFEHTSFTWYVEAPIFVFREFMRHRIASYNEESARYTQLDPVFYVPKARVQTGKPGHYQYVDAPEKDQLVREHVTHACETAYRAYEEMLAAGVAREVARAVLPVTIYSSMYVTMNARALMNFLSLRTKRPYARNISYPQKEIEMVAEQMEQDFALHMPVTYTFFDVERVAP